MFFIFLLALAGVWSPLAAADFDFNLECRGILLNAHASLEDTPEPIERRSVHSFFADRRVAVTKHPFRLESEGAGVERSKLITTPVGEKVQLKFSNGTAQPTVWEGTTQPEYERRMNFGKGAENERQYLLRTPDRVAAMLLDRYFLRLRTQKRLQGQSLYLAPLGSKIDHYHSLIDEAYNIADTGYRGTRSQFTMKLSGEMANVANASRSGNDKMQSTYIVGAQYEESVYFDTPDKVLEKHGFAARLKSWYPLSEKANPARKPVAQSLFLKRTLPAGSETTGLFTARDEIQFKLSSTENLRYVNAAIGAVLKSAHPEIESLNALQAITQVNTIRLGMNLFWKAGGGEAYKIGFLTLDAFAPQSAAPGEYTYQMEFEVFPQYYEFVRQHAEMFKSFFADLEEYTGAQSNPVPKYLQAKAANDSAVPNFGIQPAIVNAKYSTEKPQRQLQGPFHRTAKDRDGDLIEWDEFLVVDQSGTKVGAVTYKGSAYNRTMYFSLRDLGAAEAAPLLAEILKRVPMESFDMVVVHLSSDNNERPLWRHQVANGRKPEDIVTSLEITTALRAGGFGQIEIGEDWHYGLKYRR